MIRNNKKTIEYPKGTILTNDPSMTAWGWVILDWEGNIVDKGCIKTAPSHKKLRIRKGDDRVRRISEINNCLISLIKKYNVKWILSEQPHGSQSAIAATMLGIVLGMIQTLSDSFEIGLEWYSENDAKRCALGKSSASKNEMIERMNEFYDIDWFEIKYKDEAVADALSIHYVASKQSLALKLLSI